MGGHRHRASRTWRACVPLALVLAALCGSAADAVPPRPPPQQAVAVIRKGIVWYDEGSLIFKGFDASDSHTERLNVSGYEQPQIAASANAIALASGEGGEESPEGGFVGDIPPGRVVAIPQPKPIAAGGGCSDWLPAGGYREDFVLAEYELVSVGNGTCPAGQAPTREPLFVRSLRGGRWRVLLWLAGGAPPILAAEGDLLAVGTQFTQATMQVQLIDLASGRTLSRLNLPDGYLAFSSPQRLVLSVPAEGFPLAAQPQGGPFQLALYSTRGDELAQLGSVAAPPLISGPELVSSESSEGTRTLFLRALAGGPQRPVIGFNEPGRRLIALAFRWPALVLVQTTSAALAASEVKCGAGYYGPESKPSLGVFDLAEVEPFVPAPSTSPLALEDKLLSGCGPEAAPP
jgi:hypothetical protein